jgi:hypothetical protein
LAREPSVFSHSGKAIDVSDNPDTMVQFVNILSSLATVLGDLALWIGRFALAHLLIILWIAWWLWAVNWTRAWRVLAQGAWVGVVLVMIVAALVWSQMAPADCKCLDFLTVPNFWWQLGELALLAAVALFCGWLQGLLGWTPAEIDLEPPVTAAPVHGHH